MSAAPRSRWASAAVLATVLAVCGAGLAMGGSGRPWAVGTVTAGGVSLPVSAPGNALVPVVPALGLVALLAPVAVWVTRGYGRLFGGLLLVAVGLTIGTVTALVAADPGPGLALAAGPAVGQVEAVPVGVAVTGWPWVAVAGAVLVAAAGMLVLLRGRHWPTISTRYQRTGRSAPVAAADRPDQLWSALDRGEDPT